MNDCEREQEQAMALARRAYLYSLLHVVFAGEPTRESVQAAFGAQAREMLAALREEASCGEGLAAKIADALLRIEDAAKRSGDAAFLEELRGDYARLFQIPGALYVHPWESPYTGVETMLFQESTLDVRRFYHEAGFKLKAERKFPDDHIAAMMDYLGRQSQRAWEAFADGRDKEMRAILKTQCDFLDAHILNWVDAFASKVAEKDERGHYAAFASLMAAFAHIDRETAARLERELTR